MFLLKKVLTAIALPPTSLILLALAGLWVARKHPRAGRTLTLGSLLLLAVLATPIVAHQLKLSLEQVPPIADTALARAEAIVILGGGIYRNAPEYGGDTIGRSSLERTRYGLYLHRKTGLPLLVTGGAPLGGMPEAEAMRLAIEEEFRSRVKWVENQSRDTAENARLSAALLKQDGITRIALVSHVWHLPRAVELFEREGLQVYPAPTLFTPPIEPTVLHFLPNAGALSASSQVLHEWLGRLVQQASFALRPSRSAD